MKQVAFRAGQLSRVTSFPAEQLLQQLSTSLVQRFASASFDHQQQYRHLLESEFASGRSDASMACYHIARQLWFAPMES